MTVKFNSRFEPVEEFLKKKKKKTQKQINSVDVVCTLTWKQKPNYLNVVSGDKNEHFLQQNVLTRT